MSGKHRPGDMRIPGWIARDLWDRFRDASAAAGSSAYAEIRLAIQQRTEELEARTSTQAKEGSGTR